MDFDLRLLLHARTLAEEGNFARAARILHLTQPALSRSIQELERRAGVELFDRRKGRVEPTEAGRLIVSRARDLLRQAESLQRELVQLRGFDSGHLAVGVAPLPATMFMAEALAAFLRRNPDAAVRIHGGDWTAQSGALHRRELDLIVAAQSDGECATDCAIRPLTRRQGYFFVRSRHPLAALRDLSLAQILAYPLIVPMRLPIGIAQHLLACQKHANDAKGRTVPAVACESIDVARRVVLATDHVLLGTIASHRKVLESGELVALPFPDPLISANFAVIYLEGRSLPPIAAEFIEDVIAADRASAEADHALAARLFRATSGRSRTRAQNDREVSRAVAT